MSDSVIVNIQPLATQRTGQDLTSVLLLDTEAPLETPAFRVTENDFLQVLADKGFTSSDAIYSTVQAFFSTSSIYRKSEALVATATDTSNIATFLQAIYDTAIEYKFGFLKLAKPRLETTLFSDYLTFCNGKKIFLSAEENDINATFLQNETYYIPTYHNQNKTNYDSAFFGEKYISIVAKRLELNPNRSCEFVVQGATGLVDSVTTDSQRNLLRESFVNQYYLSLGFFQAKWGTVSSGDAIEKIHFLERFAPQDLAFKLEAWRVSSNVNENSKDDFKTEITRLLSVYEENGWLTQNENLGGASFSIGAITVKPSPLSGTGKCFSVDIKISYANNIKVLVLNLQEVA